MSGEQKHAVSLAQMMMGYFCRLSFTYNFLNVVLANVYFHMHGLHSMELGKRDQVKVLLGNQWVYIISYTHIPLPPN